MKRHRAILHVDMDAFFASVEMALDPSLTGKPVIVGGDPERRGVVAAASYEARKFGVHSAMPLSRAKRLCPDAVFLHGHFEEYLQRSRAVREILGEYTPLVEPAGLDEAYLDLTGGKILFGEPSRVAQEIRSRVKEEVGLPSSSGVATTKVVAKVASGVAKPDGFLEVPPGKEREFLTPLPVEKLPGVGPVVRGVLYELGISTVGELALMPLEALEAAFGSWGRPLWEYARGIDHSRVFPRGRPKSVSRETTFESDTINYELVRSALLLLSEKCCRALRREGLASSRVGVKLRHSDFATYMKFKTLPVPTDAEQTVYRVARGLLEGLLEHGTRIRLVGIALSRLVPGGCQGELFDELPLKSDLLNRTLDRIREKFGSAAITRGSTIDLGSGTPRSIAPRIVATGGCGASRENC